jgi:hypothetical protein
MSMYGMMSVRIAMFCQVLWLSPRIARHNEGSGKHLHDLIHNTDLSVVHSFGVVSLTSGIL